MNILEQINNENKALQIALDSFNGLRYGETALNNLVLIIDHAAKLKSLAERGMDLLSSDMDGENFIKLKKIDKIPDGYKRSNKPPKN